MIARVFAPGGSFGRTCEYVAEDLTRAQVIWQEGVRGHDYRLAARDFEMVATLHDTISKPVFHAVLTFHRDEKLDTGQKIGLALEYLDGVGMVNTQRLIAEHFDARHSHLHLVANRINFDGKQILNFPEVLRSRDTVERLVREQGLVPVAAKDLRQTNFDALDASDTRKYVVYRAIKESLGQVRDLNGLGERLRAEGIEMRYRLDEAGQRIGVSFLYRNEAFRGSEVDKGLSLRALERAIGQRQVLSQWEEQKLVQGKQMQREMERLAKEQSIERDREALRQKEALKQQEAIKQEEALKQEESLKQEKVLQQKLAESQRQRQTPRLRIH
jgi:Relaxase/Mobilisation nuclease domain